MPTFERIANSVFDCFSDLAYIDNPKLFWMLEERRGAKGQPYAVKTLIGWSVVGAVPNAFEKESCQVKFI